MTRWIFVAVLAASATLGACNKPEEADCRKAIRNMQRLLGTDKMHSAQNVEGAVRSCRGASKKNSVDCAIQAQTLDQLKQCPFYHEQGMTDDEPGSGSAGSGSAAAPTMAPAPNTTPEPSPAPVPTTNPPPASGSAAPAAGSAAPAAGSAAPSPAPATAGSGSGS